MDAGEDALAPPDGGVPDGGVSDSAQPVDAAAAGICDDLTTVQGNFQRHGSSPSWTAGAGWSITVTGAGTQSITRTYTHDVVIGRSIVDVTMKVTPNGNGSGYANGLVHYYGDANAFDPGPPVWGLQIDRTNAYIDFWPNGTPPADPQETRAVDFPFRALDGRMKLETVWTAGGRIEMSNGEGQSENIGVAPLVASQPGSRSLTIEVGGTAGGSLTGSTFTLRRICVFLYPR